MFSKQTNNTIKIIFPMTTTLSQWGGLHTPMTRRAILAECKSLVQPSQTGQGVGVTQSVVTIGEMGALQPWLASCLRGGVLSTRWCLVYEVVSCLRGGVLEINTPTVTVATHQGSNPLLKHLIFLEGLLTHMKMASQDHKDGSHLIQDQ